MNARVGVEAKQKAHVSAINHGGLDYAALRTGTVPGEGVKSLHVSNWDRAPKRLFIGAILRMGVSIDDWPKPI